MDGSLERPDGGRIEWIDACKAIAIFFIFFGHWRTKNGNLEVFSYYFHLQLFFIISGFFATKQQQKSAPEFLKNQVKRLFIPFVFFSAVNILYFNLDGDKTFHELWWDFATSFTDFSQSVSSQLWFLPALFAVSIIYYFLLKVIKKRWIVLLISYALYTIGVCSPALNVMFIKFMGINTVPNYLFWYALGAFSFNRVNVCVNLLCAEGSERISKPLLHFMGASLLIISVILYQRKPDYIINKLGNIPNFAYQNIKILITFLICGAAMYVSILLRKSSFLKNIGQNTLILMGFEAISKNFIVLKLIPMFNLGIVKLDTTVQVIAISIITVLFIRFAFKPLNTYFSILVGKYHA